jgi:hypothetical protein
MVFASLILLIDLLADASLRLLYNRINKRDNYKAKLGNLPIFIFSNLAMSLPSVISIMAKKNLLSQS